MSQIGSQGVLEHGRFLPWGRDVPMWARDRRRSLGFPGKWSLFGGVRPRGMSLASLSPDLPSSADVVRFLGNCAEVLAVFPVWKRAEGRHNVQPLEQLFEASLPDVQVRLSEFAGELVDFSYRDRLGLLSAEELSRWSDVLLEAVLFCGRCRAFVERVCGGDFALFLFQEGGYFSREAEFEVFEDVLKPGGVDEERFSREYQRFVRKFDRKWQERLDSEGSSV